MDLAKCKLCGSPAYEYYGTVECRNKECQMYWSGLTPKEWNLLNAPTPIDAAHYITCGEVASGTSDVVYCEDCLLHKECECPNVLAIYRQLKESSSSLHGLP